MLNWNWSFKVILVHKTFVLEIHSELKKLLSQTPAFFGVQIWKIFQNTHEDVKPQDSSDNNNPQSKDQHLTGVWTFPNL